MTEFGKIANFDQTPAPDFEDRVFMIANVVLNILQELSSEHKQPINSKVIAEKMIHRDSVKNILLNNNGQTFNPDPDKLNKIVSIVLDRLSNVAPYSVTQAIEETKNADDPTDSTDWIDLPVKAIKKHIESMSKRNLEMEEFIKQTTKHLLETDKFLLSEMSAQKEIFQEESSFNKNISSSMGTLGSDVNSFYDLNAIKMTVMKKIESINSTLEEKRQKDVLRLQEAEKTIESMKARMQAIQSEAEEIKKRSKEIEYKSVLDTLTGLYNRKAYDNKIVEVLADVDRYKVPASLMLCDIDHFKKINDTYGHKVGDLALIKLAQLLKKRLRVNDFITRYGGEEFAIVLGHTNLDNAALAGEGVRSYIDKSTFSYKGNEISLTISIGIAEFRKEDTSSDVFERADNALYLAKRSGRNMVKTEKDTESDKSSSTMD